MIGYLISKLNLYHSTFLFYLTLLDLLNILSIFEFSTLDPINNYLLLIVDVSDCISDFFSFRLNISCHMVPIIVKCHRSLTQTWSNMKIFHHLFLFYFLDSGTVQMIIILGTNTNIIFFELKIVDAKMRDYLNFLIFYTFIYIYSSM